VKSFPIQTNKEKHVVLFFFHFRCCCLFSISIQTHTNKLHRQSCYFFTALIWWCFWMKFTLCLASLTPQLLFEFRAPKPKTRLKKQTKLLPCLSIVLIYFIDFLILNVQTRTKHTHTHTDPLLFLLFFVCCYLWRAKRNRIVTCAWLLLTTTAHDTIAFVHFFPLVSHTQKAWKSCLSLFYFIICSTHFSVWFFSWNISNNRTKN
jgi:hypothetical protein